MIKLMYTTFCLLLFTTYCIAEELITVVETQTSCPSGSKCTPQWKCNRNGQGIVVFRSAEWYACPYQQICCNIDMIIETPMQSDPEQTCGIRNTMNHSTQTDNNGFEGIANFAEFPWMVAIFEKTNEEKKFIGGGSILTPNIVLTGAHVVCSRRTEDLSVRAGEWDMKMDNEPSPFQEHDVLVKICHENYNNGSLFNDIAVINLKFEFNFNSHIRPICLPRTYEYPNMERCLVAGWGKDKLTDPTHRAVMRKVSLPIVNNTICQQLLRRTRVGRYFQLHDSFVCAGGEKDLDSCRGDGGSPLFCPVSDYPDRYYQLGIVAWGLECMTENVPGVYASIPKLLTWLHKVLYALSAHPNYYTTPYNINYFYRSENSLKENI